MNNTYNINNINEHICLTEQEMFDYIDNKLAGAERFKVEKHILECELCADAMEGLSLIKDRNKIAAIKENIITLTKTETKVILLWHRNKAKLAIAASIILLATTVAVLKHSMDKESDRVFSEAVKDEKSPEIIERKTFAVPSAKTQENTNQFQKLAEKQGYQNKEEVKQFENEQQEIISDAKEDILVEDNAAANTNITVQVSEEASIASVAETTSPAPSESSAEMKSKAVAEESYAINFARNQDSKKAVKSYSAPPSAAQILSQKAEAGEERFTQEVSDKDFSYANGLSNYNADKYRESIEWFEKYLLNDPNNQQVLLYTGISYLKINNTDKALSYLNKVLKGAEYNYYEAAKYYKALALLKMNDRKEAKILLNEVVKQSGEFKQKAAEVLKDLD